MPPTCIHVDDITSANIRLFSVLIVKNTKVIFLIWAHTWHGKSDFECVPPEAAVVGPIYQMWLGKLLISVSYSGLSFSKEPTEILCWVRWCYHLTPQYEASWDARVSKASYFFYKSSTDTLGWHECTIRGHSVTFKAELTFIFVCGAPCL